MADKLGVLGILRVVANGQARADRVPVLLLDRYIRAPGCPVRQTKGNRDRRLRRSAGLPPRTMAFPDHDRVRARARLDRSMDPPLLPAHRSQEQARHQEEDSDPERMHTGSIGCSYRPLKRGSRFSTNAAISAFSAWGEPWFPREPLLSCQ